MEHALAMVGWAEWDLPSDCCRGEILFGKARGISEFHATFELWQEEPICSISEAIDCDVVDRDEKREDDDDVKKLINVLERHQKETWKCAPVMLMPCHKRESRGQARRG